ncbi:MAG: ImmA/IrrE family metallo-endopeptidase [Lawsonibacter sp.]
MKKLQPQQRRTSTGSFSGMRRTSPTDQLCQRPLISLQNYLGLHVSFARLSPDGSICGVTAYADTEYKITELGITRTLALKRNQVILDELHSIRKRAAALRQAQIYPCPRVRPSILFQLESEEVKASCEMKYSARTAYTPRELKTREDWNEWQANVLGAAILLPQKEVDLAMRRFAETPLINYEGRYSYGDHLTLRLFCRLFGVSKTTASIRLRQLGYMVDRPFSEYVDPLEVW